MPYYIYIVECTDKTYYTGITTNLSRRIKQHNEKKGAKYTKGRGPVKLKYSEKAKNRSVAQKKEYQIRNLSRKEKEKLFI